MLRKEPATVGVRGFLHGVVSRAGLEEGVVGQHKDERRLLDDLRAQRDVSSGQDTQGSARTWWIESSIGGLLDAGIGLRYSVMTVTPLLNCSTYLRDEKRP